MHIPQHVLDPTTCLATGAISAAAIGYAMSRLRQQPAKHNLPFMAVTAASIFAAQMLNVPIAAGTSGHFLGGALAGIVLGPWAGLLVMSAVIIVQCVLLGDGGFSALGANILNMAVIGSLAGHGFYAMLVKQRLARAVAAAAAAWFSVIASATVCSLELSLGAAYPLSSTLAAMLSIHSVIGAEEALVTAVVLAAIYSEFSVNDLRFNWRMAIVGIACATIAAAVVGPLVSELPDGLEVVLSHSQQLAVH